MSSCLHEAAREATISYTLQQGFSIAVVTDRAKLRVEELLAQADAFSAKSSFQAGIAEFNKRVNLDSVAVGITQETMAVFGGQKFVLSSLIEYWKAGFTQIAVRVFEAAQKGYLNFSPDHALGMCEEMEREFNQVLAGLKVKKFGPPVPVDPATSKPAPVTLKPIAVPFDTGKPRNMRNRETAVWGAVARNAPCPCGSGKRYKHCHGTL